MTDLHNNKFFRSRWLIAFCFAIAATACQAPEQVGPEGNWSVLPASESRLSLPIQDLNSAPRNAVFSGADGRHAEETAQWGGDLNQPGAGLILSEASPGPPLSDPRGPADIVSQWVALQDRRPAFSEPRMSENEQGPVTWWRAGLGTTVCVLFVQRLSRPAPEAATLSGYFCNPQGLPMSPDAAKTVVENVRLRSAPKAQ